MKNFDPLPLLLNLKNHPDFSSQKTVLLSGGTTGIGYELSKQLLALGFNIIITSSSHERAEHAIKNIVAETLQQYKNVNDTIGKIVGIEMDLTNLELVKNSCI